MKYQNEQDKNRCRPLTPASRFFFFVVSIEHQYYLNPKENGSQTRPIKSLQDINTAANTANDIRGAECVGEWSYTNGGEKPGVIEEISGSDGSGKEQDG